MQTHWRRDRLDWRPALPRAPMLLPFLFWVTPLVALALSFAGERIISSTNARFAIVPGTAHINQALNPTFLNLDQVILGYVIMLIGAAAFAVSLRADLFAKPVVVPADETSPPALTIERPSRAATGALLVAAASWVYLLLQLMDKSEAWYNLLLLVTAVAIPAVFLLRRDLHHGVRLTVTVERWEAACLSALLVFGGGMLTYHLSQTPDSMWGDEGFFWIAARTLARNQQAIDVFAPGVYSFPLASSIYQAAFVKAFGFGLWSWRLSSVVAMLAAAVPLYFLARAMFDRTVAFGSVALTLTSPVLLAFGRMGYNNVQALFPFVTTLLLVYAAVTRKSALLFFLAGVMGGLGFYTYYAARIAVVVVGGFVIYAWLTRRLTLREMVYAASLALLGAVMVGLLPTVRMLAAGNPALQSKLVEGIFPNAFYVQAAFPDYPVDTLRSATLSDVSVVIDAQMWVRLIGRGVLRTLIVFHRGDMIEQHYISGSMGNAVVSALLLPGLAIAVRRIRDAGFALLLLWTAIGLLFLSVLSAFPATYPHLVALMPAIAVAYAVAITYAARSIAVVAGRYWMPLATTLALALVLFASVVGVHNYFSSTNRIFPPTLDIALWFTAEELGPDHRVMLVYSDPKYDDYVPWGVNAFALQDRFIGVPVAAVQLDTAHAGLASADAVMIDGEESDAVLPAVSSAMPPDWRLSARRRVDGSVVYWMYRPPE